jgi:hypothetical protein
MPQDIVGCEGYRGDNNLAYDAPNDSDWNWEYNPVPRETQILMSASVQYRS